MRNVLQEFVRHPRDQSPTIVGLREHIFTGRSVTLHNVFKVIIVLYGWITWNYCLCSVSSLAGFMAYQETGFVTIGQRFLANPLRWKHASHFILVFVMMAQTDLREVQFTALNLSQSSLYNLQLWFGSTSTLNFENRLEPRTYISVFYRHISVFSHIPSC
jgi:hypothetical protein